MYIKEVEESHNHIQNQLFANTEDLEVTQEHEAFVTLLQIKKIIEYIEKKKKKTEKERDNALSYRRSVLARKLKKEDNKLEEVQELYNKLKEKTINSHL